MCLLLSLALAGAPPLLNYQGRLLDGTNLVGGSVGLSLRLFDASAAGTLLYEISNTVTVADGLYATLIGDDTVFGTLQAALESTNVWIEVAVNGTALTPRERLVSAAYAVKAQHTEVFTGAVSDGQLSANIARLDGTNQTFRGPVSFTSASNAFASAFQGTFAGDGVGVTNVNLESITVDRTPVIAWGDNTYGQTAVPSSATGVVAIAGGGLHSLALRSDGTVIAWGRNDYGQTNVPAGATGVVAIAGGGTHSLALKRVIVRLPAQLARLDASTNIFAGTMSATTFNGNLIAETVTITGTTTIAGTTIISGTFLGSPPYIKVAETQPKGTDAGGNSATTNNFRDLNTELTDTHDLAMVTNGNIVLPAGTYHCRISAPAYRVDQHQIRLRIVDGATLLYGTSEFSDDALSPGVQTRSLIDGAFTLASNAALTVQHFTAVVKTVNVLGLAANATWTDSAPYELFTVAEFWKTK